MTLSQLKFEDQSTHYINMLTRHLYRIDEVKASCQYALIKKNYREALFWSMELVDTLMSNELRQVMLSAWFLGVGKCSYSLLLDLLEADPDSLLEFVGAFCSVERDASIYSLLALGSLNWEKQPDHVVQMEIHNPPEIKDARCILRAIKQGKTMLAWTLLRCRWSTGAWDILLSHALSRDKSMLEKLRDMKTHIWESRATAVLLLCDKVGGNWKAVRRYIDESLFNEWVEMEGLRTRRVFKIRPEAILYQTQRGQMPRETTNIQEIREPLTALYDSPYWDTVAEEFGGWRPIYKNDESKEAFYELYFPDDIPDEWSRADQEKSHGLGLAFAGQPEEEVQRKHWMNLLGSLPSMGLISTTRDAIKVGFDLSLYTSKQERWTDIQKCWRLAPVLKKIVLIE